MCGTSKATLFKVPYLLEEIVAPSRQINGLVVPYEI